MVDVTMVGGAISSLKTLYEIANGYNSVEYLKSNLYVCEKRSEVYI